jgi:hypothetical protein
VRSKGHKHRWRMDSVPSIPNPADTSREVAGKPSMPPGRTRSPFEPGTPIRSTTLSRSPRELEQTGARQLLHSRIPEELDVFLVC